MQEIVAGSTGQSIDIFIQDSSSTIGAGLTGLVFNSAGLTCTFRQNVGGSVSTLTLVTQTVGGAWTSGGFVEVDSVNQPGVYRLDLSNSITQDGVGVQSSTIYLHGATNMAPCVVGIRLIDPDTNTKILSGIEQNYYRAGNTYLRLQLASGTMPVGSSIDLYGSDDIFADDWNHTIGTLSAGGSWATGGGYGTITNVFPVLEFSAHDFNGVIINIEISGDSGSTWRKVISLNLDGVRGQSTITEGYLSLSGGLGYPTLGRGGPNLPLTVSSTRDYAETAATESNTARINSQSNLSSHFFGARSWNYLDFDVSFSGTLSAGSIQLAGYDHDIVLGSPEPVNQVILGTLSSAGVWTTDAGWTGFRSFDMLEIRLVGGEITVPGTLTITARSNSSSVTNQYTFELPNAGSGRYFFARSDGGLAVYPGDYYTVGGELPPAGGASASEVNTEVRDVLWNETGVEMSALPAPAPSLREMIQFIYQVLRNQEVVDTPSGTRRTHRDDGTIVATAPVSDDGSTFTKGQFV